MISKAVVTNSSQAFNTLLYIYKTINIYKTYMSALLHALLKD